MEPISQEILGIWAGSYKYRGKKAREWLLQVLQDLCLQYSFTPQDLCILVGYIFSNFHLPKYHFLPPCIYDFNGKSEEVTDNKTFPSKQHLLLTSHVGELQSLKISTCFFFLFPRPCSIFSSLTIIFLSGRMVEAGSQALHQDLRPCKPPERPWASLFLQCHLALPILVFIRLSWKPRVILGTSHKCNQAVFVLWLAYFSLIISCRFTMSSHTK